MSGIARHHAEWLSLVETSGPFLMLPALVRALPQGLPKADASKVARLRAAYEEWAEAQEGRQKDAGALHSTWIRLVLEELLEFDDQSLRAGDRRPSELEVSLPEHHETIRPDIVIVEPSGRAKAGTPRLLVATWPFGQELDSAVRDVRWAASPLERMTQLCRSTSIRLGLVTNGERWTLVDAPVGQTAGYASWYSRLWLQEPLTLAAFEALLGVRRFFAAAETDTLEALLDESVAYQQEVTDQLGLQVRRAVEVLVQALDRADLDRQRELLHDVTPDRLYDASLTVMMRLVFLFCAEERGLLLLGDETYDFNYAVSMLRAQLREEADRVGVEVLERRQDAWARLLATFRAVYGGIEHEALRMPALGGSLFDPDRFPFLEGRAAATSWLDTPASPLPIDNRTVLHLLEALQLLRMRGDGGTSEARKLSYRALDIEQIGHVYEGLLDHVAVRVDTDMIGLVGTKDQEPELSLDDLERERRRGKDILIEYLKEHTGRSVAGLRNDVEAEPDEETEQRLLVACGNDKALLKRVLPYHALIRKDVWGYPQIYRAGSFMITGGAKRRQTGTHYTPKSLTEKIVAETLEPVVYVGPADGKSREEWRLRAPAELLDLKICDMAMGSAAFLVQVCRWLGERLVESWEEAERAGKAISGDGEVLERTAGNDLLPSDREERLSLARRMIAEHCVYGVDINSMAVELAKLSIWLVTLAKSRPFGFLDHNLRCGDSLLGIVSLDQLENLHLDPARGKEIHLTLFDPRHRVREAIDRAQKLRAKLRATRIRDIGDVQIMARLDDAAKKLAQQPELIASLLIGQAVAAAGQGKDAFEEKLLGLADDVTRLLSQPSAEEAQLRGNARALLDTDCPQRLKPRRPFHWPVEFPEVFARTTPGFDCILGNPPFLGGKRLSTVLGATYNAYLSDLHPPASRNVDLCAHFFRRSFSVLKQSGSMGLLATNSISDGDTREGGLVPIIQRGGQIYRAFPNEEWPGSAAVVTSRVHIVKGSWRGPRQLSAVFVSDISAGLTESRGNSLMKLKTNEGLAYIGSLTNGLGFVLSVSEANELTRHDSNHEEILFPYLIGDDLNSHPHQKPSRFVINFWDWPRERAAKHAGAYKTVLEKVKPHRDQVSEKKQRVRERWWLYEASAKELYHHIGFGHYFQKHPAEWRAPAAYPRRVIAIARVSRTGAFCFVPSSQIFSEQIVAFPSDSAALLAVLQSSIHVTFAWENSGKLKSDLRYSPTNCFLTFPLPRDFDRDRELGALGEEYSTVREATMEYLGVGLTELYSRFHSRIEVSDDFQRLRKLQGAIDLAVARAYGWQDIHLNHDFYAVQYLPEGDRIRYTLAENASREILMRLTRLNRIRYLEEIEAGLRGPEAVPLEDLPAALE